MLKMIRLFAFGIMMLPVTATANAIDWANGMWALDPTFAGKEQLSAYNCADSPMQVRILDENRRYQSQHIGLESEKADILSSNEKSLTIKYDGEKRLMDDGKTQVWIMYFIDEDHFAWVRQDWIDGDDIKGATPMRVRCKSSQIS